MSKQNVYSILDQGAATYARPFTASADNEAIRAFTMIAIDKEHPVGQFPADYTLHKIGTFDSSTGEIEHIQHKTLITALAARNQFEENQS